MSIIKKKIKNIFPALNHLDLKIKGKRIFNSKDDLSLFISLWDCNKTTNKNEPIILNIKSAGQFPLYCRPNSSDPGVIWSCFYKQFHLPPKKLPENSLIVDLGANVGYVTRHLQFEYPDSKIIAVEMDKSNYEIARRNLEPIEEKCILINAAIWHSEGKVFYDGESDESYTITKKSSKNAKSINSVTLKSIIQKYNISRINYLKMDIEGAEREIFNHDLSWLNYVDLINLEYHDGDRSFYEQKLNKMNFHCQKTSKHWSAILAYK